MKNFHWSKVDYFAYFVDVDMKKAVQALECLVDDLHVSKEQTIHKLLSHCGSEDFLWSIVRLMSAPSLRVSGNAAYVFGTIAETSDGIDRVLGLLNNRTHPLASRILVNLIDLLKTSDFECMMNAAGTIGTISENSAGRSWLIAQPLLDDIIELSAGLLESSNIWVSSNAALVIARISIEDDGCEKLLTHRSSRKILLNLVNSLGCDNAGKGMNCAFAIGRICDNEIGKSKILTLVDTDKLINSLSRMIENNVDNGCTKNACYALSCLAANQQAHTLVVENTNFPNLLTILCQHVSTIKDPETQWFAAMLMRIFATYPNGCVRMKKIRLVWTTLNNLIKRDDLFEDVREEVVFILDILKPLPKPNPIRATVKSSTEILCEWDPIELKNKLNPSYTLLKECSYLVRDLSPFTEYTFCHRVETHETDEKSAPSDQVRAQTSESTPSAPLNLKLAAATTCQLKVTWDPPESANGVLGPYHIYNGDVLVDQTNELHYVITGLQSSIAIEFGVCASTNAGKGEKAVIRAQTCNLGEVTPEKPMFGLIGTREILVRWQPPQVLAGKLNRYELIMNGKCVYSGVSLEHQVTMLRPDTEYKFEIVAITSEGKCKSKVSKVRTLKDEYDPERLPLYPGQNANNLVKEKPESNKEAKKTVKTPLNRQKSRTKVAKELFHMAGSDNSIGTSSAIRRNSISFFNSSSTLPPVDDLASSKNAAASVSSNASSSTKEKTTSIDENKRSRFTISTSRNNNNLTKQAYNRSKTLINFNNKQNSLKHSPTYVQPTTFTFNFKEMVPRFPLIPVNTSSGFMTAAATAVTTTDSHHDLMLPSTTPTKSFPLNKPISIKDHNSHNKPLSTAYRRQQHQYQQPILHDLSTSFDSSSARLKTADLSSFQYKYIVSRLPTSEKTMHITTAEPIVASINNHHRPNSFNLTKLSK